MVVSNPGFTALGATKTVLANFNWFCGDQMVSPPINLGFTFTYDGTGYTQFEVSDNGQVFLGAPAISCNSNCGPTCVFPNGIEPNDLANGTNRPAICPLWDDLGFNSASSALNYEMSGSSPNRVMTIEWILMDWKFSNTLTPHGAISFQVKLWESPAGQIDFIYRQEMQPLGISTQSPSANIGLMGAVGDYYSTNNTGSAISKVTQTNIFTKPIDGVQYRWTNLNALPIELVFFDGKYNSSFVKLEWLTASEKQNDYFYIERSNDAMSFETIAKIKGAGNSETMKHYSYDDPSPPDKLIYYRLRQTDLDYHTATSAIISVMADSGEKPPDIRYETVSGQLLLENNSSEENDMLLQVIDILGKCVFQKKIESSKGSNIFVITLPVSLQGIYFARLCGEQGKLIIQTRFIKY